MLIVVDVVCFRTTNTQAERNVYHYFNNRNLEKKKESQILSLLYEHDFILFFKNILLFDGNQGEINSFSESVLCNVSPARGAECAEHCNNFVQNLVIDFGLLVDL